MDATLNTVTENGTVRPPRLFTASAAAGFAVHSISFDQLVASLGKNDRQAPQTPIDEAPERNTRTSTGHADDHRSEVDRDTTTEARHRDVDVHEDTDSTADGVADQNTQRLDGAPADSRAEDSGTVANEAETAAADATAAIPVLAQAAGGALQAAARGEANTGTTIDGPNHTDPRSRAPRAATPQEPAPADTNPPPSRAADGPGRASVAVDPAPVRSQAAASLAPHAALAAEAASRATAGTRPRPATAAPAAPTGTVMAASPSGTVDVGAAATTETATAPLSQAQLAAAARVATPGDGGPVAPGRGPGSQPTPPPVGTATGSGAHRTSDPAPTAPQRAARDHAADQDFRARLVRDQVNVQIARAVSEGRDRINIQLRPEQLGRLEIRLDVGHDGRVTATVTADNRDTLELLRNDAQGLERALRDAGLNADGGNLNFNLRGEAQQDDRATAGGGPQANGTAAGNTDGEPSKTASPPPHVIGPDRVDIRA